MMADRLCNKCGAPFVPIYNEETCAVCIGKAALQKTRNKFGYKNARPLKDKPCEDCGETMHGVTGTQRICDRCRGLREIRRREIKAKKDKERQAEEMARDAAKRSAKNIAAVVSAARSAGMTYGQFVALQKQRG